MPGIEHVPHVVGRAQVLHVEIALLGVADHLGRRRHAAVVQVDHVAIDREGVADVHPEILVAGDRIGRTARDRLGGGLRARHGIALQHGKGASRWRKRSVRRSMPQVRQIASSGSIGSCGIVAIAPGMTQDPIRLLHDRFGHGPACRRRFRARTREPDRRACRLSQPARSPGRHPAPGPVAYRQRSDRRIRAASEIYGDRAFDWTGKLEPSPAGDWENYVKAAAQAVEGKWKMLYGIDAAVTGDLPSGGWPVVLFRFAGRLSPSRCCAPTAWRRPSRN